MCDLELEKMQLQQGLKSHTSQLVDRDLRIRKLSQRLDSCNDVIKQQRHLQITIVAAIREPVAMRLKLMHLANRLHQPLSSG